MPHIFEAFIAPFQFFVELNRLFLHFAVGVLRTAEQMKIRAFGIANMPIVIIQPQPQKKGLFGFATVSIISILGKHHRTLILEIVAKGGVCAKSIS